MNIVIITEGTAQTGYGHLTRCLAIYQGFVALGMSPQIIANCDDNGKDILQDTPLYAFDWINDTQQLMNIISCAEIALVDSYLAELSIYEKINGVVEKTAYLDDTMRLDYPPGVIINGTVNAENFPYKKDSQHLLLLGTKYTPLRSAFWKVSSRECKERSDTVLITIGGHDPKGITLKILAAAYSQFPDLKFHVVLGFSNHQHDLKPFQDDERVLFYRSLDDCEMRDLMLACDVAISAAGQTSYEIVKMGLQPIFIQVAENQHLNIKGWYEKGVIKEIINVEDKNYISRILDSLSDSGLPPPVLIDYSNSTMNIVRGILDADV